VIFLSSFMKEDGHGVLYGNGINVLKVFRMDGIGSSNLSSSGFIDGMCVAALAPAVITMSGSIFQPLATMFLLVAYIC
jgi:energy-converting hydrogenase Eha subunit C